MNESTATVDADENADDLKQSEHQPEATMSSHLAPNVLQPLTHNLNIIHSIQAHPDEARKLAMGPNDLAGPCHWED